MMECQSSDSGSSEVICDNSPSEESDLSCSTAEPSASTDRHLPSVGEPAILPCSQAEVTSSEPPSLQQCNSKHVTNENHQCEQSICSSSDNRESSDNSNRDVSCSSNNCAEVILENCRLNGDYQQDQSRICNRESERLLTHDNQSITSSRDVNSGFEQSEKTISIATESQNSLTLDCEEKSSDVSKLGEKSRHTSEFYDVNHRHETSPNLEQIDSSVHQSEDAHKRLASGSINPNAKNEPVEKVCNDDTNAVNELQCRQQKVQEILHSEPASDSTPSQNAASTHNSLLQSSYCDSTKLSPSDVMHRDGDYQKRSSDDEVAPATDKLSHEQLASSYNVLFSRYLLIRQQRDERLTAQRQMEIDFAVVNARLASVIVERDNYLARLKEFEDLNSGESEEMKQLELTMEQQKQQILVLKEMLSSHENSSQQTLASTQTELKAQIEQMRKKFDDCEKDRQSMVIKYAQAEQKNIELTEKMTKMDVWMKDWAKHRDNLMGRLNATAAEKQKLSQSVENKSAELATLKKEVERQKELVASQEMKAKWHQNKLKVELESHKETRTRLEDIQQKLHESKEECEKVKQESQAVIKNYQMSQILQTITKERQLKETEEELQTQRLEQTEQKEVLQLVKQELDSLKLKEKELVEELKTYKDKVICLDAERILQEETLAKFKDTLQNQKKVNYEQSELVAELEALRPEIAELKQQLTEARNEIEEQKQANKDLSSDMDSYVNQESEHLKFSQRLSDETVRLQSENLALGDEIASLTNERESLNSSISILSVKSEKLETELKNVLETKQRSIDDLERKLSQKTEIASQQANQLEERDDELKTLKRRHISSSKDLRRQLLQLQKRLEVYEAKGAHSNSTLSRASSSGSLDSGSASSAATKEQNHGSQESRSNIASISDIDKDVLIDKIIKLQKSHARKNEKLEFMQDHISQLLDEVKKKSKIIQNYIMREESYALGPLEAVKQSKTMTSKKSGIVTSMFVSSETGRDVYEDLVEHNSRLQTVLEDKVIHNLTLKHTVETLGQEISQMSKENQKLQLELRQLRSQLSQPSVK